MRSRLGFWFDRLGEKLWVRPLVFCLLAILAALAAAGADNLGLGGISPEVERDTIQTLLSIIAASMLGVATFAVASMVSAYASVSGNATPRAFLLVVSDDVSKTALSTFIAAFIFSVISLIAIKTGLYARTGLFVLFVMTIAVIGWVVFTFVRWVDQIARLGRLGTTINRVERAAEDAIKRRRRSPNLGALPVDPHADPGMPMYADDIGYVQHIDVQALQTCAEQQGVILTVAALPGTFAAPGRPLAHVRGDSGGTLLEFDDTLVKNAFLIGHDRTYEDDPRFGLIALSEIAARALSPAVNDPGTAIGIIGTFVRLFALWVSPLEDDKETASCAKYYLVRIPSLTLDEMFDDAFTAISRDGAGAIEVVVRLQKAFISLASIGHEALKAAAYRHSRRGLERAVSALTLPDDIEQARTLADQIR